MTCSGRTSPTAVADRLERRGALDATADLPDDAGADFARVFAALDREAYAEPDDDGDGDSDGDQGDG